MLKDIYRINERMLYSIEFNIATKMPWIRQLIGKLCVCVCVCVRAHVCTCTHSLEEEMATHSSILAWETSWTEEPAGLQSIGLQRVRHDWARVHACFPYLSLTSSVFLFCWDMSTTVIIIVVMFLSTNSIICVLLGWFQLINISTYLCFPTSLYKWHFIGY